MKYYIIAGEASGDLHGANLMKALHHEDPNTTIRYWGGDLMSKNGGTLVKHYKDLAFMGFVEVLLNLKTIFKNISFLDFIRDVGKHISVNYMMAKDSVKNRLEDGMSFTEFSYQLVQGYDFYHLWKEKNVKLQMGGSDQWGNITSGIDLIRRMEGGQAHAITYPLVTKADGTKFGKSADGAVWLDPDKTSPYKFYQFWMNTADADVIRFIKIFTFLSFDQIMAIAEDHEAQPERRRAHQQLADAVTLLVHGDEALAVPPFAEVVEVLVPLQLDFGTVELGRRGVGEAADDRVVVEAREDFDRVLDILVEQAQRIGAGVAVVALDRQIVVDRLHRLQIRVALFDADQHPV